MNEFKRQVNEQTILLSDRIMRNAERGLMARLYDCIDTAASESCRTSKVTVFGTLEAYIDEHSHFANLVLDNFRFIFLYYFLACSLVFVAFAVHLLVKFDKMMHIVIFVKLRWLQVQNFFFKATLFFFRLLKFRGLTSKLEVLLAFLRNRS